MGRVREVRCVITVRTAKRVGRNGSRDSGTHAIHVIFYLLDGAESPKVRSYRDRTAYCGFWRDPRDRGNCRGTHRRISGRRRGFRRKCRKIHRDYRLVIYRKGHTDFADKPRGFRNDHPERVGRVREVLRVITVRTA